MSESKPRVTIVGLGLIGSSLGLALRKAGVTAAVIGHDSGQGVAHEAKRIGAVDKTDWNLISACEEADLVILATPVRAIEELFKVLARNLRPGCVILDTAAVKQPVMAWAAASLPDEVHFVGGNPILSKAIRGQWSVENARADLFEGSLFCLVPAPETDPDAIQLVSNMASIIGSRPLFLDAAEHDGLVAAVDHLPTLLSLAMLETVIDQPAWRELRKVAGPAFESSTQLVTANSVAHSDLSTLNRENVVRWIDALSAELASLREVVAEGDIDPLDDRILHALEERQKWLHDRGEGIWYEGPDTEMPTRTTLADALLGSFWRRKPKGES
ncbi:MAG: prephenate dehydrogenase [Anaerolineae bacterium]|jgi:prephenate dehydrogenase